MLTWIHEKYKLETCVVNGVKLEFLKFALQFSELIYQWGDAEQGETEDVKLLSIWQCQLVGEPVVDAMIQVVQQQHVGPGILQQLHLVVHL